MTYLTAGGEAVLRTLPAASAIQNLPVAPRPVTMAPRMLPAANWGPAVSWGAGTAITPYTGGTAAAAAGTAGSAAAAGTAASTALAVAAGVAALGFGFAVGDALAQAAGIEYPGGKNALQYFAGGRSPGLGANGGGSAGVEILLPGEPPFKGGQSPGVLYTVRATGTGADNGCEIYSGPIEIIGVPGPISLRNSHNEAQSAPAGGLCPGFSHNFHEVLTGRGAVAFFGQGRGSRVSGFTVTRTDGAPDTGGDPAGEPIKTQQPRARGLPTNIADPPIAPARPAAPTPTTTPTAPPGAPANPPAEKKAPGLPDWLYQLPYAMPAAAIGAAGAPVVTPGPNVTPVNNPEPGDAGGGNSPPRKTRTDEKCRCNIPLMNKFDDLEKRLDRSLGAAGVAGDGGIFAQLLKMQSFAEKAWSSTKLQKVMNALTLLTVVHNATMISKDVGETLGFAISQGLDVLGVDDEKGEPLNVNMWFGKTTTKFFEGIFGVERWRGLNATWNKANRIISSASNIVYTIRSISDGVREVTEMAAENTGKIGNALKRSGLVTERSYPWMAEKVRAQDAWSRKTARLFDGLESAENIAGSFAAVTSNVKEIQDEITELDEQTKAFQALVGTPPETPKVATPADNAAIVTAGDEAKNNARSGPAIAATDMEPAANAPT